MHYQKNNSLPEFWERLGLQLEAKKPFVVYRKPNQTKLTLLLQNTAALVGVKNWEASGFIFAPFDDQRPAVLLRPDELHEIAYTAADLQDANPLILPPSEVGEKEAYVQLIKKALQEINSGQLQKVVLSRRMEYNSAAAPIDLFKKLLNRYLNAMCYLWYHPKVGVWLGASPEVLLKSCNEEFLTMALAGTQKYIPGKLPIWKNKELAEQAMVTDYVATVLKNSTEGMEISPVESVRAGNLWHLRTSLSGKIKKNHLGNIIQSLHPTPAVCGIPRDTAKAFILANENYDREYYTGYLGELNFKTETEKYTSLYVNLRCMQVKETAVWIYIGGGVIKASVPEDEWQETVEKSSTMLNILLNSR